jgi:four helix bundle protein
MKADELKDRTKQFALRVLKLVAALPKTIEGRAIASRLVRRGTSVAANYRATCRARSKAEFIAKVGVVLEEADETLLWLELFLKQTSSRRNVSIPSSLRPTSSSRSWQHRAGRLLQI